jgi:elongation factor G
MTKESNYLAKIRNIGNIAHIDAGKTTTTERMLYHAKMINVIREVRGKNQDGKGATMDYLQEEIDRGITIISAATTFSWKDGQINLIDTPGHVDFTAEVERSLRVLDGAIVILDSKKGVEAQTETVWSQADKYNIPRLIFLNKMDGVDNVKNRFEDCCKNIRDSLLAEEDEKNKQQLLVCQIPIGEYQGIEGIIDLVEEKAYYFQGDWEETHRIAETPSSYLEKVKIERQELIEQVLEYDEELSSKYLEGHSLSVPEIKTLIRKAVLSMKSFAVFCGSAYKHIGVKLLLDRVIDYLPSPLDRQEITVFSEGKEGEISILNYPYTLALSFKVTSLSFGGKLTFIRVYCGKISAGTWIYNVNKKIRERVSRLVRVHADKHEIIGEVKAGEIAGIIGLKYTTTGDTLCDQEQEILLEQITFAEPVVSQAIELKSEKDQDKLSKGLNALQVEDPTFRFENNPEARQITISGMGELHLEIAVKRLKSEFGIEVQVGRPQIAYRETFKEEYEIDEKTKKRRLKKVPIHHLHKKQTGGAGQRAEIWLEFEPNPGKGFEFVNALRGEKLGEKNKFVPAVEEGLLEVFLAGPLLKRLIVDVKVTLTDGAWHRVDSSELAFKNAAEGAFRENINKFNLTLLEPIANLEVNNIPKDCYGKVTASIISRRGGKIDPEEKKGTYSLKAEIPLAETFGYTAVLRSLTEGKAVPLLQFSHYQEVPDWIMKKLLEKNKPIK